MIEIDRTLDRLRVRTRPSPTYRAVTWGAWMVALAVVAIVDLPATWDLQSTPAALLLLCPFLVAFALLLGWTTTESRFDRASMTLVVSRTSPMLGTRFLKVSFTDVTALVERADLGGHRVEVVLADNTSVALARADDRTRLVLGRVARDVSQWLEKPLRLARGTLIGERFEIEQFAAQGSTSVVYRARDRQTSKRVALKLKAIAHGDASSAERVSHEMACLATLEHPGIVRYVASGTSASGQPYLATEWVEGETLAQRLERAPLSFEDSIELLKAAARALGAAHAQGTLHRNLEPTHLLLRGRSVRDVVLLDFAVAPPPQAGHALTGPRSIPGALQYFAPEQALSAAPMTAAADVFSLGSIFYECLTGLQPFVADQPAGVFARLLYDQPDPIQQRAVPDAWSGFALRLLAKAPDARPADGNAIVAEIAQLEAASLPPNSGSLPPPDRPRDSGAIEQVFVSVVLANLPAHLPDDPRARSSEALPRAAARFDCPVEQLANGSILATLLPRASSTDQARAAARCALYLREALPDARIAVATGFTPFGVGPRAGVAADRAAHMLAPSIAEEGIRLDSVTARLLDASFATVEQFGVITLVGERAELDQTQRTEPIA